LHLVDPELSNSRDQVLARYLRHSHEHAEPYGWPQRDFSPAIDAQGLSLLLDREQPSRLLWVGHVASAKSGSHTAALQFKNDELSAAMLFSGADEGRPSDEIKWRPVPSRVGLVACRSGADFGEVEPFGLVVAFLESGAELVTATRWTLPTDYAFSRVIFGEEPFDAPAFFKAGPFNAAAHAVDDVLNAESPIIWASIANYHAPYRTVESVDETA
jgi:hypothetical protein